MTTGLATSADAGRGVSIIDRADHGARHVFLGKRGGHVGAELIDAGYDAGVDVGLPRIDVRRKEDAGLVSSHLVNVVDDLRMPGVVGFRHRELRLLLRERVPVTIVVVTHVELIEPGQRSSLETGPDVFPVIVDHPLQSVGIERGNVEQDHVVQDLSNCRIVGRGELPQEPRSHLGAPDLRGVDAVRHQDHGLAVRDETVQLGRTRDPSRVRELHLDPPQLVDVRLVPRAGHRQHHERPSHGGRAERVDGHAPTRFSEFLVVGSELAPVGQLPVGPDLEPEVLTRGRDGLSGGGRDRHRDGENGR